MPIRRRLSLAPGRINHQRFVRMVAAEHAIQKHHRIIDALHHIATLALRDQPLPEVLQMVVQEVRVATGLPIAAIEFYDPVRQCMEFAAVTGAPLPPGLLGLRVPVDQTLSGVVAASGQPMIETHAQGRPEYTHAALRALGVETFVCLPLIVSDQVIGTLALAHPEIIPLDANLIPLAQSLAGLIATLVARRRAEAELQVTLTKYRTLFESFPLGITVADSSGHIVEANRMAEELLGLHEAEQRQRRIDGPEWQIVRPDGSPMPAEEYASVRALRDQRLVENVEMGIRAPRGRTTWINVTAAPLTLDGGGIVITYGDITERRQAEELIATQRDLARLIATTTDPAIIWPCCLALVVRVCGMDCGGIYLFDAAQEALELVAHQGLAEEFVRATACYGGDALNTQLLLADTVTYLSAAEIRQRAVFEHEALACVAIMPIRTQGRVVGCVNLGSHTLPEVPAFARHALETIATEIGNILVALRGAVALREREEQYRSLVDSQESSIATIDTDGVYHFINMIGAAPLTGSPATVIGRRLHDFFPPQIVAWQVRQIRQVLASGRGSVVEVQHALNGTPHWYRTSIQPIRNAVGIPVLAMVNALDITERRQAEEQLRESRLRVELALKGANLGMWDWEVQTGRAVFNERWAEIVGYTLVELAPLSFETWTRLCHPDDLRRSDQLLQQHIRGETAFYECEIRMRHKDGRWIWVSSRGQIVEWDAARRPLRMAGTHLDITDRKHAEQALRELNTDLERRVAERTAALQASQERLALATRSAGIGIWDWDIRANTVTWDERMYELYGITPAAFGSAYEAWLNGLHPDDRAEADRVSLSTRRGEQEYDTEFRVCHPDGKVRVLKAHAFVQRGPDGEALRMIGMNFDITERKQAEAALYQANLDMARAARMKNEFLANMSHELRSPLNAILGFSENLQEAIYGPLSELQHDAVHHIETSGRHLLALITDILDLSKVEAGYLTLAPERFGVAEICEISLLFVKELALKKSLHLSWTLPDPLAMIEADPRRLKQMLINLLSNAVKFTPDGGEISLNVTIDEGAGVVRFAVCDTGIGIAPAEQARLFHPFVQLDSSLNRRHMGTGLGLALVRRLAELHGGHVTLHSVVGAGSCFTLILPQAPPGPAPSPIVDVPRTGSPPAERTARAQEPYLVGAHILLVEDNEATIQVTRDYLQVRGVVVRVARTGQEALATVVAPHPDLIVMDIQLPELDGLELMRQLRAMPAFATTPIIALTALVMPGDRERCLEAGATAYLTKPVQLQELLATIGRLLRL